MHQAGFACRAHVPFAHDVNLIVVPATDGGNARIRCNSFPPPPSPPPPQNETRPIEQGFAGDAERTEENRRKFKGRCAVIGKFPMKTCTERTTSTITSKRDETGLDNGCYQSGFLQNCEFRIFFSFFFSKREFTRIGRVRFVRARGDGKFSDENAPVWFFPVDYADPFPVMVVRSKTAEV